MEGKGGKKVYWENERRRKREKERRKEKEGDTGRRRKMSPPHRKPKKASLSCGTNPPRADIRSEKFGTPIVFPNPRSSVKLRTFFQIFGSRPQDGGRRAFGSAWCRLEGKS
jgi:hypothetical protein